MMLTVGVGATACAEVVATKGAPGFHSPMVLEVPFPLADRSQWGTGKWSNEKVKGGYVGGTKFRPREKWVIQRDTHERMISDEQAELIFSQRARNGRKQCRRRHNAYLLAGLLRCACGASFDGEAGYYRCHGRCGSRSIKQETVEQAVLRTLFVDYLTTDTLAAIREELLALEARTGNSRRTEMEGLQQQLKDVSRKLESLTTLLTEVAQPRPLLAKIDELEAERVALAARLQATPAAQGRRLPHWDEDALRSFVVRYQNDLEFGDPETKKTILRTLVASAALDGDELTLVPNYPAGTGVSVASPTGFEPVLPP